MSPKPIYLSHLARGLFILIFIYPNHIIANSSNYAAYASPSNKQLSRIGAEPPILIDFKGIPLGQPGIKGSLQIICLEKEENKDCANLSGSKWLVIDYGPLKNINSNFLLSTADHLLSMGLGLQERQAVDLIRVLSLKYGPVSLHGSIYYWRDSIGNLITIERREHGYLFSMQAWNWILGQERGLKELEEKRRIEDRIAKDNL